MAAGTVPIVRIGHDADQNDLRGGKYRYLVSFPKDCLSANLFQNF
jgi:hypothetical protein